MAWRPPPPTETTPRIDELKNSASRRAMPCETSVTSSERSGSRASKNEPVTREVTKRFAA